MINQLRKLILAEKITPLLAVYGTELTVSFCEFIIGFDFLNEFLNCFSMIIIRSLDCLIRSFIPNFYVFLYHWLNIRIAGDDP